MKQYPLSNAYVFILIKMVDDNGDILHSSLSFVKPRFNKRLKFLVYIIFLREWTVHYWSTETALNNRRNVQLKKAINQIEVKPNFFSALIIKFFPRFSGLNKIFAMGIESMSNKAF